MASSTDDPHRTGKIIVCGQPYSVAWTVKNFLDFRNYSAYLRGCHRGKDNLPSQDPYPFKPYKGQEKAIFRYRSRRQMGDYHDLHRLQEIIRQFVIHHDGLATSDDCFHVLHDERGLSVHFLIDNDGTIIQTLDLAHEALHAGSVNEFSIGVELCNRGPISLDGPDFYRIKFPLDPEIRDRGTDTSRIKSSEKEMWVFLERQYKALIALGRTLREIFPNLPQVYPQEGGKLIRATLQDPKAFSGYLGHYHIAPGKWDPGCFDFERLIREIRTRSTWFICLDQQQECERATEIAEDRGKAQAQGETLINMNEEVTSMGGYYPVGPFGKTRLWHGGVHLSLPESVPVFCPFPGRIVAASNGDEAPTGSTNFVLMRHSYTLAGKPIKFYLLFYHLEEENPGQQRTPWFFGADQTPWWPDLQDNHVVFPGIDVAGGAVIGHVGRAGPPGEDHEPQLHIEVMAPEEIGQKLEPGYWKAIDASKAGRFCNVPEVIRAIDRPAGHGDGQLSARELAEFFQGDDSDARAGLRRLSIRFLSEWGGDLATYQSELLGSADYRKLSRKEQRHLISDQIKPMLWWTREVARQTGLPGDFLVWHYHPVRFIAWMNEQLDKRAVAAPTTDPPPQQLQDDLESSEGAMDQEEAGVPADAGGVRLGKLAEEPPKDITPPHPPDLGQPPSGPPPAGCASSILRRWGPAK